MKRKYILKTEGRGDACGPLCVRKILRTGLMRAGLLHAGTLLCVQVTLRTGMSVGLHTFFLFFFLFIYFFFLFFFFFVSTIMIYDVFLFITIYYIFHFLRCSYSIFIGICFSYILSISIFNLTSTETYQTIFISYFGEEKKKVTIQ